MKMPFSHRDLSAIPARTNFAALKHLGVRIVITFSAVGRAPTSFFDGIGLVLRAGFSNPSSLRLAAWLAAAMQALKVEGRAVKLWTKKALGGGDLIGMIVLPEAKLAREAKISFAFITTSTDFDAWRLHEVGVTAAEAYENAALAYVLPEYFKAP
ncbi:nucleoside phosphorylase domain-containing protein [Mycena galericulata]|nr:nucleoside phosphorylase domain-containing protein [Mycena galericulata]